MLPEAYNHPPLSRHEINALPKLRQDMLEGKPDRRYKKYPQLYERAKRGEFIRLVPPQDDIRNLILFFEPPLPLEEDIFSSYFLDDDSVPFLPNHPMHGRKAQDFLEKVWSNINWFSSAVVVVRNKEEVDSSAPITPTTDEQLKINNAHRFGANFKTAIHMLVDGYAGGNPRNTGEPKALHPMRVFMRLRSDQIVPFIKTEDLGIAYVSWLAALLHDADEDFDDFRIVETEDNNWHVAQFKDRYGKTNKYRLALNRDEADQLRLQIDALTIPKEALQLPMEEKAAIQFAHLRKKTEEIAEKYGVLAAFFTLYTKWNDQLDNLFTYWTLTDGGMAVPDPTPKLLETIEYFTQFESDMKTYLRDYSTYLAEHFFDDTDKPPNFCRFILFGGTYKEAFKDEIRSFFRERNTKTPDHPDPAKRRKTFDMGHHLLIPTILPHRFRGAKVIW